MCTPAAHKMVCSESWTRTPSAYHAGQHATAARRRRDAETSNTPPQPQTSGATALQPAPDTSSTVSPRRCPSRRQHTRRAGKMCPSGGWQHVPASSWQHVLAARARTVLRPRQRERIRSPRNGGSPGKGRGTCVRVGPPWRRRWGSWSRGRGYVITTVVQCGSVGSRARKSEVVLGGRR